MQQKWDLRLSGTGGQGLILGGIILASAAVVDGYNAVQSQSYGPEARGGASKAEVIISTEAIFYPKVGDADIFLAMSQAAYEKYSGQIKEETIIIIDSTLVKELKGAHRGKYYPVPITGLAKKETGREMTANIVALGVIMGITHVVSEGALKKAVLARIPAGTEELNMKALNAGIQAGITATPSQAG
ncbi:2-oxoacid:acceptor oxidoreductase family protein [Candidatus Formimonas warabiya]|uniref:2-oxoglutarate ferredoxin oxidoreductase subunit gamma n=1 Tax=Formimonas warabiya TaxID=1761012 RepID=A0A3G1KRN5_FORW1|nr:2-oxoacid:acceptor oxidoreductase family protein [Candidatus Formimonas warabiya]ATW25117.1 2-oxoglutarate ferredoxin oxidoreductase subunit gamma [Candidatus Formimonas warabiya]